MVETGLEEVSCDKKEDEEDTESQDESEGNNSDASEDHSPQKKKQRLETVDDESNSAEERDKCIERSGNYSHASDKKLKFEKNSENCSESQTLSENKLNFKKSMQNGKVRKPFKEKTITEEIAEESSDENSDNDGKKFCIGRVDYSSQSKNSDGENIKRKSTKNIHSRKRLAKRNKELLGNLNSSDEESAKESLVSKSNHQVPKEDFDFKLNLDKSKCSESDKTDVSDQNEDDNKDLSCEAVANDQQNSDDDGSVSSKEDKENKMLKNTETSTKKRQASET